VISSRRRHTRSTRDWSSDVCSSDLPLVEGVPLGLAVLGELLDGGLDERDAAEVAVHLHVVDQVVDRAEAVLVLVGPDQLQVLPRSEERRVGTDGQSRRGATLW